MKIKALVSFSGALSMHKGEVKEYSNEAVLLDLLQAGYIEEIKDLEQKQVQDAQTEKPKKGVKSSGSK